MSKSPIDVTDTCGDTCGESALMEVTHGETRSSLLAILYLLFGFACTPQAPSHLSRGQLDQEVDQRVENQDTLDQAVAHEVDMEEGESLDQGVLIDIDAEPVLDSDVGVIPIDERFFAYRWKATHNSYEGGTRGPLLSQLNQGVRAIEFDLHDNEFSGEGYRLGHLFHGDAVDHSGGNPSSDRLEDWLDVLHEWSVTHPDHAPLILTIDLKDNLVDNRNFSEGNLAHLNHIIQTYFPQLWLPKEGLDDLQLARGHILCVLSGDQRTRRAYLADQGSSPSISASAQGRVLELHDSGLGELWYWSGRIDASGELSWSRHGQYDRGRRPASLISPSDVVIEVHQAPILDQIWISVGELDDQGELSLQDAVMLTEGSWPTLAWIDPAQGDFALRFERWGGTAYEQRGRLDPMNQELEWGELRELSSTEGRFSRDVITIEGRTYQVSANSAPPEYPTRTLWIREEGQAGSPIRYDQLCFVEWQKEERADPLLGRQAFGAVPGSSVAALPDEVRQRYLLRGWQIPLSISPELLPHIPSTDTPFVEEYHGLFEGAQVAE